MQKKSAEDEHNDDIEEAFKVFDTKNDGYNRIVQVYVFLFDNTSKDGCRH